MVVTRLAASVCLRHGQMEQGPTEPHAGRSTFLLSSGGAGGGYYCVAFDTGPIATKNQIPCQALVVRRVVTLQNHSGILTALRVSRGGAATHMVRAVRQGAATD